MNHFEMCQLFASIFDGNQPSLNAPLIWINDHQLQIGCVMLNRTKKTTVSNRLLLRRNVHQLERLAVCIEMNWLALIVGNSATGKTTLIEMLAELCGVQLKTFYVTGDTDAMELLGTFEQVID